MKQIGKYLFDTNKHTAVMGILNVTPDSFSDGGSYKQMDDIRFRVRQMIEEGAEIIDIGGESTRPGYTLISDQEEIERVAPVIACLKKEFDVALSVDTYKSAVAKASILEGCDLINDIWGLKYDDRMAAVIAESQTTCCLMHNRRVPVKDKLIATCMTDLQETLMIAAEAGISDDKIILDPGIGFAKSYEDNLSVMHHLNAFHQLGYPLLLGASRKSMIGLTLDLPVSERVEGTAATSVFAVMAHYAFVRVHDIKENFRAIRMAEAIRDSL